MNLRAVYSIPPKRNILENEGDARSHFRYNTPSLGGHLVCEPCL